MFESYQYAQRDQTDGTKTDNPQKERHGTLCLQITTQSNLMFCTMFTLLLQRLCVSKPSLLPFCARDCLHLLLTLLQSQMQVFACVWCLEIAEHASAAGRVHFLSIATWRFLKHNSITVS